MKPEANNMESKQPVNQMKQKLETTPTSSITCSGCSARLPKRMKGIDLMNTSSPIDPAMYPTGTCPESHHARYEVACHVTWDDDTTDTYWTERKEWKERNGVTRHTLEEAEIEAMKQDPPTVYINPAQQAVDIEDRIFGAKDKEWLYKLAFYQEVRDRMINEGCTFEELHERYTDILRH